MKYFLSLTALAFAFPFAVHMKYCEPNTELRFGTVRNTQSNVTAAQNAQTQHCFVSMTALKLYPSRYR